MSVRDRLLSLSSEQEQLFFVAYFFHRQVEAREQDVAEELALLEAERAERAFNIVHASTRLWWRERGAA